MSDQKNMSPEEVLSWVEARFTRYGLTSWIWQFGKTCGETIIYSANGHTQYIIEGIHVNGGVIKIHVDQITEHGTISLTIGGWASSFLPSIDECMNEIIPQVKTFQENILGREAIIRDIMGMEV